MKVQRSKAKALRDYMLNPDCQTGKETNNKVRSIRLQGQTGTNKASLIRGCKYL